MPDKQAPPVPPSGAAQPLQQPESEWVSWSPKQASYVELTARLASADLKLCELQAHMDELIEANCRLRSELGAMTLQWVIEKTKV